MADLEIAPGFKERREAQENGCTCWWPTYRMVNPRSGYVGPVVETQRASLTEEGCPVHDKPTQGER